MTDPGGTGAGTPSGTGVLDVHVHALPPALVAALCASPDGIDGFRAGPVDGGWAVSIPGVERPRLLRPPMVDAPRRAAWAADQGIGTQVVMPWLDLQPTAAMPPARARDWALRLNAAMVEAAMVEAAMVEAESAGQAGSGAPGNLVLATIAVADGDQAAADLERAVTDGGMSGLVLSTSPAGRPDLADPALSPVWEAAAGLGVPVVLHPPTDGPARALPGGEEFGNTYCRLVDTTFAVARLLLSGVLDRHPELRLVVVHGGGFLAYQAMRLDGGHRADALARYRIERSRPSEYLGDLYFDTVAMSAAAIRFLVETVGAGHVMLGSDYPFPLGDRAPVATVRRAGLAEEQTALVLGGAAQRLFQPRTDEVRVDA